MTAAERIIRLICRLLPPALSDWGEAMAREAASIDKPGAALAFSMSCGAWVLREALSRAARSALRATRGEAADDASSRPSWKSRQAALLCAIAATGAGLVFLAETGAPLSYLILNLTALIAGLIMALPFRRHDPVTTPFVGVVAVAAGLVLVLTAIVGDEVLGARRWLSLGGLVVQPSLLTLPFLLVAFARCRDMLTTAGLMLGAVAIALQPDRAMAGAMVIGIGASALLKRDRKALSAFSVALVCLVVTMLRPQSLLATSFTEEAVNTASSQGLTVGVVVWAGIAGLLLPSLLGLRQGRGASAAHAAFGATWSALILAGLFTADPVPVVAYGGSAIVGYVWSILALPANGSRSEHALTIDTPSLTCSDRKEDRANLSIRAVAPIS